MNSYRPKNLTAGACLALLAFALVPATILPAQTATVANLRFVIEPNEERDAASTVLAPGGRYTLPSSPAMVIRAVGDDPRYSAQRVYPSMTYRIVSGSEFATLSDERPKGGTVVITANSHAVAATLANLQMQQNQMYVQQGQSADQQALLATAVVTVEWALGPGQVPADGRYNGTLEFAPAAIPLGVPVGTARAIVNDLYRGILVREPDPGAQTWIDLITRDGYAGVVEAARQIANSPESQRDIYTSRTILNAQRLTAMYTHLQGRGQPQVSMDEWNRQLTLLNQQQIETVVLDILWGDAFFSRHQPVVKPRDRRVISSPGQQPSGTMRDQ